MADVYRNVSAVFRKLPDPKGTIAMIHNGRNKIEVDDKLEALWFEIDNHKTYADLYERFLVISGFPDDADSEIVFGQIIDHFVDADFIDVITLSTGIGSKGSECDAG